MGWLKLIWAGISALSEFASLLKFWQAKDAGITAQQKADLEQSNAEISKAETTIAGNASLSDDEISKRLREQFGRD